MGGYNIPVGSGAPVFYDHNNAINSMVENGIYPDNLWN